MWSFGEEVVVKWGVHFAKISTKSQYFATKTVENSAKSVENRRKEGVKCKETMNIGSAFNVTRCEAQRLYVYRKFVQIFVQK